MTDDDDRDRRIKAVCDVFRKRKALLEELEDVDNTICSILTGYNMDGTPRGIIDIIDDIRVYAKIPDRWFGVLINSSGEGQFDMPSATKASALWGCRKQKRLLRKELHKLTGLRHFTNVMYVVRMTRERDENREREAENRAYPGGGDSPDGECDRERGRHPPT